MPWSPGIARGIVLAGLLLAIAGAEAADRHRPSSKPAPPTALVVDRVMLVSLVNRLEALEARLAALENAKATTTETAPSSSAAATAGNLQTQQGLPHPGSAPSDSPQTAAELAKEDLSRALERALVREGGLVLPRGVFELEPRLRYEHRSTNRLELLSLGGQAQLAQVDRKLDLLQAGIGIRIGMPWATQLEAFVPYASNREHVAIAGGMAGTDNSSGFGNVEIGITRQLLMRPGGLGLLGSLRWVGQDAASQFGSAVATGSSFGALQGSLLFVMRRDPVVFFGGLSQSINRERRIDGRLIDPGDTTGLRLGSIVALSPDTSLRLGLDLSRSRDTRADSLSVAGSGLMLAEFSAGFSFALTPQTLLGIEAGIGLTPASPDLRIGVSLPVRF